MRRVVVATVLLAALSPLAACDSGPSGPGDLTAVVTAPSGGVGAVILQVQGQGIKGFVGAGATEVLSNPTGGEGTFRVVAVNEGTGTLQFRVQVEDLGAELPTAGVISAAGTDNQMVVSVTGYQVRFER
jgi:hypothetical protein